MTIDEAETKLNTTIEEMRYSGEDPCEEGCYKCLYYAAIELLTQPQTTHPQPPKVAEGEM